MFVASSISAAQMMPSFTTPTTSCIICSRVRPGAGLSGAGAVAACASSSDTVRVEPLEPASESAVSEMMLTVLSITEFVLMAAPPSLMLPIELATGASASTEVAIDRSVTNELPSRPENAANTPAVANSAVDIPDRPLPFTIAAVPILTPNVAAAPIAKAPSFAGAPAVVKSAADSMRRRGSRSR